MKTEASKLSADEERKQMQDKYDWLTRQRNIAQNEGVELNALYQAALRRIAELEATISDLKKTNG